MALLLCFLPSSGASELTHIEHLCQVRVLNSSRSNYLPLRRILATDVFLARTS